MPASAINSTPSLRIVSMIGMARFPFSAFFFLCYCRRNLITGQQQNSGAATEELLVEQLRNG